MIDVSVLSGSSEVQISVSWKTRPQRAKTKQIRTDVLVKLQETTNTSSTPYTRAV
jgi:hypothetical protein